MANYKRVVLFIAGVVCGIIATIALPVAVAELCAALDGLGAQRCGWYDLAIERDGWRDALGIDG